MNREPMNCEHIEGLLNGYVDGELDLLTTVAVEEHLQGCPACSSQRQTLERLRAAVSDRALYHTAPAGLEGRIRGALQVEAAAEAPHTEMPKAARRTARPHTAARHWPALLWPALSRAWLIPAGALLAILIFLAGFFARGLLAPQPDAQIAQEVQTAHVRSLMANHLMDVASSDQHTVKPWFNGKLDFSPPVTDLAAQGFPLVGGRLDYLDGRPVAALVYRRNKHLINLFIWPDQGPPTGSPTESSQNGYNLFHWTQSGMTFWAISDLNAEELQTFIRLYRANT